MKEITGKSFDEERALYASSDISLKECRFEGIADGESALKESRNISADKCFFDLRYPFWHVKGLDISGSHMTERCRAAIWYSEDIRIKNTKMHGIKALRECRNVEIEDCSIVSPEFGWSVSGIKMRDSSCESEYFLMRSSDVEFSGVSFKGKYSFQYVENAVFTNCVFDTKDAFWHAKNVVVRDSVVKGEYLAWYSGNILFENCEITGTQPFCYCKGLKLINCTMEGCDLAFEKSEAEADIRSSVASIKNPYKGTIRVYSAGEIIMDDPAAAGVIEVTG
ncbi:MAG: DUF3737 family protein [Saccharofermentans sp.]|nr:DUF3737 family protein [Saccharofermentans sp.]